MSLSPAPLPVTELYVVFSGVTIMAVATNPIEAFRAAISDMEGPNQDPYTPSEAAATLSDFRVIQIKGNNITEAELRHRLREAFSDSRFTPSLRQAA